MKTSLKKIDLMFTSPLNIYWSLSWWPFWYNTLCV
jgi:hypothetical protein